MSTQPHRWNEYGVAQDPNLIEITIDNLTYVQISTAMAPDGSWRYGYQARRVRCGITHHVDGLYGNRLSVMLGGRSAAFRLRQKRGQRAGGKRK
jgi:hypothetical protein